MCSYCCEQYWSRGRRWLPVDPVILKIIIIQTYLYYVNYLCNFSNLAIKTTAQNWYLQCDFPSFVAMSTFISALPSGDKFILIHSSQKWLYFKVKFQSSSIYFVTKSARSREFGVGWKPGASSQWKRQENQEASNHLLQPAAASPAPAFPADPVSGLTGARRPGRQTGTHADAGGPLTLQMRNEGGIINSQTSQEG